MGIKDLFRKKKKEEVVDLSDLQKRGIYNPKPVKDSEEVVDLSSNESEDSSPLGFLGAIASSNESTTETDSPKKQKLKEVLREIKADIKNTGDKVYKLSDRLDLIEKKLERIERRVGL